MKDIRNQKVWLFLLFLIVFPVRYSSFFPKELLEGDLKSYSVFTQHFSFLWLSQACLGGILLLQPGKLVWQDWLVALGVGLVSCGITIPLLPSGVLNGFAAGIAYLAVKGFIGTEEYPFFIQPEKKERYKNIGIIVVCVLIFFLLRYWMITITKTSFRWNVSWEILLRGLAAGISEELIFRMLLLAIAVKLAGGTPPFLAAVLLMTLPFAMYHAMEPLVYQNVAGAVRIISSVFIRAVLLVCLLKERDCVTAMLVHAGYDIVVEIVTYSAA